MSQASEFGLFLGGVEAFADFGPQDLAVLEQAMRVETYPDGHLFLREDRQGDRMYLIVTGVVVATHKRARIRGVDVFERLGPGELFGLVALIDHRREWATYRAEGPVEAASLPSTAFELLFSASAPIAHHFQGLIAQQLVRDVRACVHALREQFGRCG